MWGRLCELPQKNRDFFSKATKTTKISDDQCQGKVLYLERWFQILVCH